MIESAFSNSMNISQFEKFSSDLREVYNECRNNMTGQMSDYVPQLCRQNADLFGLSVCTVDGQRMCEGDTEVCDRAHKHTHIYLHTLRQTFSLKFWDDDGRKLKGSNNKLYHSGGFFENPSETFSLPK